jgi:serine/threonine protein kinase/tetratricopeptide (TPR) repeat protein
MSATQDSGEETVPGTDARRPERLDRPRRTIGRYMVIEELGRGGMGVVYSAYDPDLDRKVAIKVLRRRDETYGERLRREAQAMARLSHPNVVVVFEVGRLEEQMYLVMDHVEGSTLSDWLRAEPRSHEAILAMFLQALEGLAAAHDAGLVHRDFKPDNVLVSASETAKVLDFGIAKAVSDADPQDGPTAPPPRPRSPGDGTPQPPDDVELASAATILPENPASRETTGGSALDTPLTVTGSLMGTPAYMSPEQHGGASTDARTDQFSYAVALWAALFGERPFGGEGVTALGFNVRRGNLRKPPAGHAVPTHIERALTRALSTEPENRFESMRALAEALTDDPRLVRRRRLARAGAAAALIVTVIGLVALWPADRSCEGATSIDEAWNPERRASLREQFESTSLNFATDAADRTIRLLDTHAEQWRETYSGQCSLPGAERHTALACLDQQRSEFDAVVRVLLDANADTVESSVEAVSGLQSPQRCTSEQEARALASMGVPEAGEQQRVQEVRQLIARSKALSAAGRSTDALPLAERAVARSATSSYLPIRARAKQRLGRALRSERRHAEAIPILESAANDATAGFDDRTLARVWIEIGRAVLSNDADFDRARRCGDRAEAALARLGSSPAIEARLLTMRGHIAEQSADHVGAVAYFEQSLELWRSLSPTPTGLVANSLSNLSAAHKRAGEYDRAEAYAVEAYELQVENLGEEHPGVSHPLYNLARIHRGQHRVEQAIADYERVIEIRTAALGPNHPSTTMVYNNLANAYRQHGDLDAAGAAYDKALAARLAALGKDHHRVALVRANIANLHRIRGELPAAREQAEESLRIRKKVYGDEHEHTASVQLILARISLAEGEPTAALALLDGAMPHLRGQGDAVEELGEAHFARAQALAALQRPEEEVQAETDEARALFERSDAEEKLGELDQWAKSGSARRPGRSP